MVMHLGVKERKIKKSDIYGLVTTGFSGSLLLHDLVNKLYSYNDGKTSSTYRSFVGWPIHLAL
jgi:hypothetical protein